MKSEFVSAIIDNAPFGIAIVDNELRYVAMNRVLAVIDGLDGREVVGKKVFELLPHLESTLLPVYRAVLDEGRQFYDLFIECELPAGSGQLRRFSSNYYPITLPDGSVAVGVMLRDITAELALAKQRDDLLAAEQEARNEADKANRTKDDFLASLSHELRTPLNAILGWAQLLRRKSVAPELYPKGLEVIERNARDQAELISDLLDMSRIIAGKLSVEFEEVDIHDVASTVFDGFVPLFAAKGIKGGQFITPVPGPVLGDRTRLQQILANLLSNSLKFTPSGGTIGLRLFPAGDSVEISVTDTGIGIEPSFLPQIFRRFTQEDASITKRTGGLGIGLSIVHHLVKVHNGEISVASGGRDKGATFTIRFPLVPVEAGAGKDNERDRLRLASAKPFNGMNILVVEDDPSSRELFNWILSEQGASVDTVSSADAALACMGEKTYDLLISDIGLPGEDGYSLIRKVRALTGKNRTVPAVAVTAFARPEDSQLALQSGFHIHLAKPIAPDEVISTVYRLASTPLLQ